MTQIRMHGRSGYGFGRKEKERELRERQSAIISAYCEFVKRPNAKGAASADLPYPKSEIVEAFLNVIANSPNPLEIEHAALSIMQLATFQNGGVLDVVEKMKEYGANTVQELSPTQVEEIFQRIDVKAASAAAAATSSEVAEFRQEILAAKAQNRHLLPWYVKLWHKIREQGAYSPFADEFVTIRYPR